MLFIVMKELFVSAIMQTAEVLVNTFVFLSVSFFMFSCCKGHSVRSYLDTIQMNSKLMIGARTELTAIFLTSE